MKDANRMEMTAMTAHSQRHAIDAASSLQSVNSTIRNRACLHVLKNAAIIRKRFVCSQLWTSNAREEKPIDHTPEQDTDAIACRRMKKAVSARLSTCLRYIISCMVLTVNDHVCVRPPRF